MLVGFSVVSRVWFDSNLRMRGCVICYYTNGVTNRAHISDTGGSLFYILDLGEKYLSNAFDTV